MKQTKDNSFDSAFRERLAEATVVPSEYVWEAIAVRLEKKKPKKKNAVAWFSVAASLVMVSAIWWLSAAPPNAHAGLAKVPPAVEKPLQQSSSVVLEHNTSFVQEKKQQVVRQARAVGLIPKPVAEKPTQITTLVSDTPAAQAEQIADYVEVSPVEVVATNAAILPEIPAAVTEAPVTKRSKKRIRSLSDLVNFVVAKVDDREEKVLETSNDGAILSLTALNVGPIRFKKNNTEK